MRILKHHEDQDLGRHDLLPIISGDNDGRHTKLLGDSQGWLANSWMNFPALQIHQNLPLGSLAP